MFSHKVVHVTLSGTMMNGGEEWQTGFYLGQPDADAQVPTQAAGNAIAAAWEVFFEGAAAISNWYSFTQVKLARLTEAGKYDGTDVVTATPATAVWGTRGGAPFPPQIALVATLVAGSGKGLAGKGRMYLPGICEPLGATGHIPTPYTQSVATALAAFFNTVNGSMDMPGQVINASAGRSKLAGIGARNVPVNGVRVGNVYDTQRRRRNGFSESYVNAVVAD